MKPRKNVKFIINGQGESYLQDELANKAKKYAGKISTKDILKTVICHDVENDIKMCVNVITDKNANYLLKRIVKNDNAQYVLSICDSSVLPQEIQSMQ